MTRTVASRPGRVGHLPADMTSFLGRRRELGDTRRLLSTSRLITLTGPAGVGKTRLGLHLAADVRRWFHGRVWFVELADLHDADLVPNTVADQIGLSEQAGRPALDTIIDELAAEPGLLVLDNCEHLVDTCALFVQSLMQACGELRLIATSRQSLGLLGENIYPVPPLQVPDPSQAHSPNALAEYDSVRFFVERAGSVVPSFTLDTANCATVARVCHDLGGIPLAIELTAVRLRSLSLDELADRLRERRLNCGARGSPTHQRTLQSMIDWSWELCSHAQRRVWARASVFASSFDLDSVEGVCAFADVPTGEVLAVVDALVDKSIFLRADVDGTARYRMPEITRSYGEDKLVENGELAEARRQHRDYFARMVARFVEEQIGPRQADWILLLRKEHANLRLALDFCAADPAEAVTGLRMATQLDDYWGVRGYHGEARLWLQRLLSASPEPTGERTSALRLAGWFALLQGDAETAQQCLPEAGELAARLDIPSEAAYLAHAQGMAALVQDDLFQAVEMFGAAYEQFQQIGELRGELLTQFMYGLTLGVRGERRRGLDLLQACIDRTARLGDVFWQAYALWARSYIEVLEDALDSAESAGKQALRLQDRLSNKLAMSFTLDTLAWVDARRGRYIRAATLFGSADTLWEEIGSTPDNYPTFAAAHREHAALTQNALADDAYRVAFDRGRRFSTPDAVRYALGAETGAAAHPLAVTNAERLTRREQEVAELVAEGLTNQEIATRLVLSRRTAESHVEHILTKLGFHSRTQIATWVVARGR